MNEDLTNIMPFLSVDMTSRGRNHYTYEINKLGRYVCPKCRSVSYKHKATLTTHLKFECGVARMFPCFICEKSFKRKTHLKAHLGGRHKIAKTEMYRFFEK